MTMLVLLGQLWAFMFVAFFGSELLGAEASLRAATQVLFVLPLLAWAAWRLRGPRTPLDWAMVMALTALAVVSLTSADPQGSRDSLALALAYALGFWAMRAVGAIPRLRAAIAVAVSYALTLWLVLAACFWILEKVDWIQVTGAPPPLESAQVFIWGTTNAFPAMALVAAPFIAWQRPGPARRILFLTWGLASLVVVPLSVGRAAWLGIGVSVVAYEALTGFPHLRPGVHWLRARRGLAIIAGTAALPVLGLAAVVGAGQLGGDRLRIWSQAVAIFATDPLTGGGPTTFSWLRLAYVPDYVYPVPVRLAHNVAMQTLADGGVLLALAFVVLLATYVTAATRRASDMPRRVGLAVIIGFAAASFLDDFSSLPAIMACVITVAAWVISPERPEGETPSHRHWMLPAAVACLFALAAPAVVGVDQARMAAADGRSAAVRGDWHAAQERFAVATSAYPGNAGYWLGHGLAAWHAGDDTAALSAYRAAYSINPADARAAGALAELATTPEERARWLDIATRQGITDPQYAFRLGAVHWSEGDRDAALAAYGLAVAIDPALVQTLEGRGPAPGAVIDAALREVSRLDALDGYVVRDDTRLDIALITSSVPEAAPAPWRAIAQALAGNLVRARELSAMALAAAPGDRRGLQASAAVACLTGDVGRSRALLALAGDVRPSRPSEVRDIRDHTYRDQGLGSYQPLASDPYPATPAWPWSIVGAHGGC
ncbi:MAG: O-antigen ligase family protein [Chloroflexota bacterium]